MVFGAGMTAASPAPPSYEIAFDLSGRGYVPDYSSILIGLFGIVIIVVLMRAARATVAKRMLQIVAVAGVFLLLFTMREHWRSYEHLRGAASAGRALIVEAPAAIAPPPDPRKPDNVMRFAVGGHDFSIPTNALTPEVRARLGENGQGMDGRCLRVAFVPDPEAGVDRIVWIGVRREGCAGALPIERRGAAGLRLR